MVLEAHVEGSSLRGIRRKVNLVYNTAVSLVKARSKKKTNVKNGHVKNLKTSQVTSNEL